MQLQFWSFSDIILHKFSEGGSSTQARDKPQVLDIFENPYGQAKKKEHKCHLFGSRDRPVGWGSSKRRGGDRKVRALPRKFVVLGPWTYLEILPGCPGPLRVFKKFVQKKFVRIFRSLYGAPRPTESPTPPPPGNPKKTFQRP